MPRTRWPARAPRWPGPGFAGVLIKLVGAPLALLVDAVMLLVLGADPARHPRHERRVPQAGAHFWRDLRAGLRFVRRHTACW